MKQSELALNDRLSDFKAARLMDAWNAHNAAELDRCDAIGPACALACNTPGWVPPSEVLTCQHWHDPQKPRVRYLGGNNIWCGRIADAHVGDEAWSANLNAKRSKSGLNVCRLFDESHYEPHVYGYPHIGINQMPLMDAGSFSGFTFKIENKGVTHVTPPNHGHDAKCGCGTVEKRAKESYAHLIASSPGAAVITEAAFVKQVLRGPVGFLPPGVGCPWCAGTGHIICDDERAGRVSPSHAAGGYAEWQRRNTLTIGGPAPINEGDTLNVYAYGVPQDD